ncbi:MAG: Mth938-like domain-containing protein [Candidatus Parabeggiatoa sp.]|nr:protein containing DUF498 [Beggiatoa sp. SS]MEC4580306.1 Mth938-like domain-containing protein [Candidatus Parabeggiatoa sp.]
MKLHLDLSDDSHYQIQRVDSQSVTINEKVYSHNIIVQPNSISDWDVENFDTLEVAHFQQLCALRPELVLLGTGQKIHFPATELLVPLINEGIGVEVMDTPSACRTYTILMAEGRKVLAALLIS